MLAIVLCAHANYLNRCHALFGGGWNKLLDSALTDEEKAVVMQSDILDLHFGLGMFIRNKWLYSAEHEEMQALLRSMEGEKDESKLMPMLGGADYLSTEILNRYVKHLKRMKK